MKGIMMKICAVLLTIWYCMSIIGFDVHTCNGTGRTFVATFAEGLTCADIHPEHRCAPGRCGAAQEAECCHADCCTHSDCCSHQERTCRHEISEDSCCSDSYQSILLTGFRAGDDHRHYDECHCGNCPCMIADYQGSLAVRSFAASHISLHVPDIGDIVPCDPQVVFSVWRI